MARLVAFAFVGFLASCTHSTRVPSSYRDVDVRIVPGSRVGPITASTSEDDLRQKFPGAVESVEVPLGEGDSAPGTALFAKIPRRHVDIVWHDAVKKRRPRLVFIYGPESDWRTDGVAIGSTLAQLEKANGKPFQMYGFEWDNGGAVCGWKDGKLAHLAKGSVRVTPRLGLANFSNPTIQPLLAQVVGDTCFVSSNPALRKLNPQVFSLVVDFP